jgi:hypothetical protein
VGLVGDDHDVVPVGEHGKTSSSSPGMNFWMVANTMPPDGRLASRRADPAGCRLHRLLAQQILGQREHAEQLAVQVVAVGDDDDGGVLHRRFLHHPGGEAGHGDALAAALGVPHHAARPWWAATGREAAPPAGSPPAPRGTGGSRRSS